MGGSVSLLASLEAAKTGKLSRLNEDRKRIIEVDDITYKKLLEFCNGRDISREIYCLVADAQSRPMSGTVKTISKYYDTEKYKRTAAADIKHALQKEGQNPRSVEKEK